MKYSWLPLSVFVLLASAIIHAEGLEWVSTEIVVPNSKLTVSMGPTKVESVVHVPGQWLAPAVTTSKGSVPVDLKILNGTDGETTYHVALMGQENVPSGLGRERIEQQIKDRLESMRVNFQQQLREAQSASHSKITIYRDQRFKIEGINQ